MAFSLTDLFANDFPNLESTGYQVTSPADTGYNCIAWAAGDNQNWWEPDPMGLNYWPPEAPRSFTIDAYVAAFQTLGFEPCSRGEREARFDKIAIFALHGAPTHAAKQLKDGTWTSKLGLSVDIGHAALDGVSGPLYGEVVRMMRRRRTRTTTGCLAVLTLLCIPATLREW